MENSTLALAVFAFALATATTQGGSHRQVITVTGPIQSFQIAGAVEGNINTGVPARRLIGLETPFGLIASAAALLVQVFENAQV